MKITCIYIVWLNAVDTLQTGTGRHGGVEGGSWSHAMAPAHRNRMGVPPGVVALEAAEVLAWGPIGKAIAWDRRDAHRIGDEESVRPIVCGALMPRGGRPAWIRPEALRPG